MQIEINVSGKIATVIGTPVIVCGNSDYVVNFIFDEAWEEYADKTARFMYRRGGKYAYIDVVFHGNACNVPILSNITECAIGVYAGDLVTTTPAKVPCEKSILCNDGMPEDPADDVYTQIMAMLNDVQKHYDDTVDSTQEAIDAAFRAAYIAEGAASGVVTIEQNSQTPLKFWVGTQAEYDAMPVKDGTMFYIISDDNSEERINKKLKEFEQTQNDIVDEFDNINAKLNDFAVKDLTSQVQDIASEMSGCVKLVTSGNMVNFSLLKESQFLVDRSASDTYSCQLKLCTLPEKVRTGRKIIFVPYVDSTAMGRSTAKEAYILIQTNGEVYFKATFTTPIDTAVATLSVLGFNTTYILEV